MFRVLGTLTIIFILTSLCFANTGGYVEGTLLVRFSTDVTPAISKDGTAHVGITSVDEVLSRNESCSFNRMMGVYRPQDETLRATFRNDYRFQFPVGSDMEAIAEEMRLTGEVEWACPDYLIPVDYEPNDPQIYMQWFQETLETAAAWDLTMGDENILFIGIDSGTDWNHPDLADKIWVNPGEDIDNDPRPFGDIFPDMPGTEGDWDNLDNDDNGLIDDFIGWDWVQNVNGAPGEDNTQEDNNPMDFHGHGTGVAGAFGATADNATFGCGVAPNCKIMANRTGYCTPQNNGLIVMSAATSQMVYATDMVLRDGYIGVVNMSFGGNTPFPPLRSAVEQAYNAGLLLFGAAGNDGVGTQHYPAAYPQVVAVGATTSGDDRASFSNWGTWVDVSAPGEQCYTAWFDDHYEPWDGTSVASPIAAGVGALVISMFPEEDNSFWRNVVINSTDPITTDHPLGSGRVNAYNAVTQYYWPNLSIESIELSNPDGNYHPDPGETIDVFVSIENTSGWQNATDVVISIEFDREELILENGSITIAEVDAGSQANNSADPLSFRVPDTGIDGVFTTMLVTVTASPHEFITTEEVRVLIGTPEIMFVDDDGGVQLESFYFEDFQTLNMPYNHIDRHNLDYLPTLTETSGYDLVIWFTGNEENPLSETEISLLEDIMDQGDICLFLSGESIDEQLDGTDFYREYLHAEHVEGNGMVILDAFDNAGGPIEEGSRLVLTGPGGASNCNNPDLIQPVGGAVAAYHYYSGEDQVGGLFFDGPTYDLVYFAFPFEATSGAQESTTRSQFIQSLLTYIGTDVEESSTEPTLPSTISLDAPYPNPFNSTTTVSFNLPEPSEVSVTVYNIQGQRVATLLQGVTDAGPQQVQWFADDCASGVYFVRLTAAEQTLTRKVMLLR